MTKTISKRKLINALKETLELNRVRIQECNLKAINEDNTPFKTSSIEFVGKIPSIIPKPYGFKLEIIIKSPFKWKKIK